MSLDFMEKTLPEAIVEGGDGAVAAPTVLLAAVRRFVAMRARTLPKSREHRAKAERLFGLMDGFRKRKIHVSSDSASLKKKQVEMWVDPKSGQSTGRIRHPGSLLRAVHTLVDRSQVDAIAVVGRFPDDGDDTDDYRLGKGIDLLAGLEAIISHMVVKEFQIPCAHAPALLPLPLSSSLCPRSAAEEIGYTFLPCVLAGLSRAPQYTVRGSGSSDHGCILASDVDSVILPNDACGGEGSLAFARSSRKKPLIIAVEENETVLNDTPDKLGMEAVKVLNYWEAVGVIAAHKAGIDPKSLRRNGIGNIECSSSILPSNGFVDSHLHPSIGLAHFMS